MIKDVWFQLMDASGVTLLPPRFLPFDADATVAAFTMAVKSACTHTALAHVDVIALAVHAEAAAEPLEYDSPIGHHGSTTKKPLLVVLPPQHHHRRQQQFSLAHGKRQREEAVETVSLKDLWEITTSQMTRMMTTLPSSPEEVAILLQRPLPFRMALLDPVVAHTISDPQSSFLVCEPLACVMNHYCVARDMPECETGWQKMFDILLDITMSLCVANRLQLYFSRSRNRDIMTPTRPDFLLFHDNGLVLLRGEETRAQVDINVPFHALTMKMRCWNPLFYGNLPYILGYAVSGPRLRVVMIDRQLRAHTILDLDSIVQQDAEVLKVFYNLAFFLAKMVEVSNRRWATGLLPYTENVTSKRTLMVVDDAVIRTITLAQCRGRRADFHRLVTIYKTLKALNESAAKAGVITHLPIVAKLVVEKDQWLCVHLAPVGVTARPSDAEQVLEWVRAMLTALVHWHGRNYCHGDIRWANIVYVPVFSNGSVAGYWVLIDVDESREPETTTISWNHRFHGQKLTFQHDLAQLGQLLEECPVVREDLAELQKALCQASDIPLLTAKAALAMVPLRS